MANATTDFIYPRKDDLHAAPPDDGGHQGSYTRPEDTLIAPEVMSHGVGAPMLQYTNDFPRARTRAPMMGLMFILIALVLGLLLAFWVSW
jgi:hypothetical protein